MRSEQASVTPIIMCPFRSSPKTGSILNKMALVVLAESRKSRDFRYKYKIRVFAVYIQQL